jgi:hypothetical protein
MQLLGFANFLTPTFDIEQEYRERLEKQACLVPNEVFIRVLGNENLAS